MHEHWDRYRAHETMNPTDRIVYMENIGIALIVARLCGDYTVTNHGTQGPHQASHSHCSKPSPMTHLPTGSGQSSGRWQSCLSPNR